MLSLRRVMTLPGEGECAKIVDLRQRGLRTRIVSSSKITYDDALLPSVAGPASRRRLVVNLSGRALLRGERRTRDLAAGEFAIGPWPEMSRMRSEGAPFRLLAIDWHEDVLADVCDGGRLGPTDFGRLELLATELLAAPEDARSAAAAIERTWDVLRAAGVPLRPLDAGAMRRHAPRRLEALASALGEASSRLEKSPMLVDLQTAVGRSRRQLSRNFRAMRDMYGFDGACWREVLDSWRLQTGVALMTHPAATTSIVARTVGYSSSVAFCHACERAGLPAPGRIRRHLGRAP